MWTNAYLHTAMYPMKSYEHGAIVNAAGADFGPWPKSTMLKSTKPVISVCSIRTGCGKSQTSRKVIELLMSPA